MPTLASVEDLKRIAFDKQAEDRRYQRIAIICGGTGCAACGCRAIRESMDREVAALGLGGRVKVRTTGCHGYCEQGPLIIVEPEGIFYRKVTPEDVPEIVSETLGAGQIVERLLYTDPVSEQRITREIDIPFYKAQDRVLLDRNRLIDPRDIREAIAQGGYSAFLKALTGMTPEGIIAEISASGLRGRGGAGFPTGKKWESCRRAHGRPKYVVCNADEGDPGAFMDRSLLEGNPHAVIEGMLIGAFAIGAEHGFVYVRKEYPLAVENTTIAIRQAEEMGLLGANILGTRFSFDIKVARGGGAFVCGESTALMASLEGRVGEPRPKDVHTTDRGFLNLPTNLNNVETWANVPLIIALGASWFAAKGTTHSKGTKIFALTGAVRNTGLVEVPMGTTLLHILHDIGGGSADGRPIKAIQIGGPSGGCLPEGMFYLPVDFEELTRSGAMVGSGGLVVMGQDTCMVDVARYFLRFLIDESCGACVPCRIGVRRLHELVCDIAEGRATEATIPLIEELAETVATASLCGLGKTAPNPLLTALRYFREEYEAHVHEKRCPAGACKALIRFSIDQDACNGCGACEKACPHGAIAKPGPKEYRIESDRCRKCGICKDACRFAAVRVA
jgi:NADH-quinone oxidoreductase subunit F